MARQMNTTDYTNHILFINITKQSNESLQFAPEKHIMAYYPKLLDLL